MRNSSIFNFNGTVVMTETNLNYELAVEYHNNGRILLKQQMASAITSVIHVDINYQRRYFYENSSQPNTLTRIEEQEWVSPGGGGFGTGGGLIGPVNPPVRYQPFFEWDATGNMTYHHHEGENSGYDRYLCWDEENRLQGVVDDTHQTFYQYDANGERTYKMTTREWTQLINGHWNTYIVMDNLTLYASPYLVATRQGYTKHYYADNDRIASKIGMGGLTDICQCLCPDMILQHGNQDGDTLNQSPYEPDNLPNCEGPEVCFYEKLDHNNDHFSVVMGDCLGTNPDIEFNILNEAMYSRREDNEEYERDSYWYHPDHLGSSSWITYTDGEAVQHLLYLPWGEDFVDQRTSNWAALYTFSAKEKDTETGLSYFGARYYSSDLSIWLSVDPMSDKYPSLSPYVYCANNPIKLVDPNGEEVYIFGKNRHRNTIIRSLNKHFENISIGYNKKSGQLYIEKGTALTNDEIAIADAISDKKIEVNIQLSKSSTLDYKNSKGETLEVDGAGAFLGNTIFYDGKGKNSENIRRVRTLQHISMKGLAEYYKKKDWGALVNHEITESFQGGVISSTENVPGTSEQGIINVDIYKKAHFAATRQPTPKKYKE